MCSRVISIVIAATFVHLFSVTIRSDNVTTGQVLTREQALSALRSRQENSPGAGYVVIRTFTSTTATAALAQRSLDDAQSSHIKLFHDGILIDLLKRGGFL